MDTQTQSSLWGRHQGYIRSLEYHDGASSFVVRHQAGEIKLDLERLQRLHHSMKRKSLEAALVRHLQIFCMGCDAYG